MKLTYFAFPGRGYPIRAAFGLGNVAYENEIISYDELRERRGPEGTSAAIPLGFLPVLTMPTGRVVSESGAIARYAGKLANLYPQDAEEALLVDEIIETVNDLYFSFPEDPDDEELRCKVVVWVEGPFDKFCSFLAKKIATSEGKYATGDGLTIADLYIYSYIKSLRMGVMDFVEPTADSKWPEFQQLIDTLESLPEFAPYKL